jgi:hypothetical protein
MLQPTIYIPSRLTRLLAPLGFSQREVLPALSGLLRWNNRQLDVSLEDFRGVCHVPTACCCPS